MMRSLRARLVGLAALAVLFSLAAVAVLHQIAAGGGPAARASRLLLGGELPEPWQDVAVLLPFSILILLLTWTVSVLSLRPLLRASHQAARVGPRDPGARIDESGLPGELRPLVEAVNGALDRLAGAFETERRFTQDAAHELRTPLAALTLRLQRARLDGAPDWDAIGRDLAHMARLVSQLLDLARKQAACGPLDAAPINLARVAREAAASILPLIEDAGRVLHVDLPERVFVRGQADDLRDVVSNLLENALKHGQGSIGLMLRAGNCVELDVTDEGPGVPAALRRAIFDRFRKARQETDGSGLGLAIARAVIATHGGAIAFVDGPACRLRVTLAAAEPPHQTPPHQTLRAMPQAA